MRQLDLGGGPVEDVLRWARHRSEAILEELGGDPEAILDGMLAGLGQGEFPVLDGSATTPAAAVVAALIDEPFMVEVAPLASTHPPVDEAVAPTSIADSGVALRVLAELGEGDLPADSRAEAAAEVYEGESLGDDLDPLAGLVDDDDLPIPVEPPLAESLGPPLLPGLADEVTSDAALASRITDDDEASLPPVTDDDEASLPPLSEKSPTGFADDDLGPPLLPGLDEAPSLAQDDPPPPSEEAPLDLGPPLLPGFESDLLGPPPSQEPNIDALPQPAPDDRWSGESDWSERSFLLGIPDDETLAAAAAELRRGREDDAPVARRREPSSRGTRAASGKIDAAPPPPPEPAKSGAKDKKDKKDKKAKKKSQGVVVLDKAVRRTRPRPEDGVEEIDDVELLDE